MDKDWLARVQLKFVKGIVCSCVEFPVYLLGCGALTVCLDIIYAYSYYINMGKFMAGMFPAGASQLPDSFTG